jgi:hypothetical protein
MIELTGRHVGVDAMLCPDDDFMCGDPGLLTCLGELNDCSGQGDCYKGHCYCHTGWGGADCSVAACIGTCDDVRLCLLFCSIHTPTPCPAFPAGPHASCSLTVGFYACVQERK